MPLRETAFIEVQTGLLRAGSPRATVALWRAGVDASKVANKALTPIGAGPISMHPLTSISALFYLPHCANASVPSAADI